LQPTLGGDGDLALVNLNGSELCQDSRVRGGCGSGHELVNTGVSAMDGCVVASPLSLAA
jgi:hypothetical protein